MATEMTSASAADLATIPVVDISQAGPVGRAREGRESAYALRDDCLHWLPAPSRMMLPVMDTLTRRWLERSASPYVPEIAAIVEVLEYPGIWFLNGCYQWGCTSVARDEDMPWLARTLDWPFPGLGRRVELARMRGPAGSFVNVAWPGFVGSLTALAPGRFAASINQAPLWRRTRHPWLRPYDLALNALSTWRLPFIPPDHLLREVLETCGTFGEARDRLETTPVARPVIYTLVGCRQGERCVIERTEQGFETREDDTAAANDWLRSRDPWEARVSSRFMFKRSYQEAAERCHNRRQALAAWPGRIASGGFDWVTPPVLNALTRLAVEMCPASGVLRAVGFETAPGAELAHRVTEIREIAAAAA
jgi:hypothetical protein